MRCLSCRVARLVIRDNITAMGTRDWIKQAEQVGWRVSSIRGLTLRLACSCIGCPGSLVVPLSNLGGVPAPCPLPHVSGHGKAAFGRYEVLVADLVRRRVQLGLSQPDLDAAIGWPDGYCAKLESGARTSSPPTLLMWCDALGLQIITAPAPMPDATRRAIEQRAVNPYRHDQARFKDDRQPRLAIPGA
jgi:hypothetical protein